MVREFPNPSANIGNFVGQKKQRPRNLLKREVKCRRALCFECAEMTKCISFDWRSCQFVSWMESPEKRFDGRPVVSSSGTSRHRGPLMQCRGHAEHAPSHVPSRLHTPCPHVRKFRSWNVNPSLTFDFPFSCYPVLCNFHLQRCVLQTFLGFDFSEGHKDCSSYSCWRRSLPLSAKPQASRSFWDWDIMIPLASLLGRYQTLLSGIALQKLFLSKMGVVIKQPSGSCLRCGLSLPRPKTGKLSMSNDHCSLYSDLRGITLNIARFIGVFITWIQCVTTFCWT